MVSFSSISRLHTLCMAGKRAMAMSGRAWEWAAIFAGEAE